MELSKDERAEVQRIRKGQILREICKENQKPDNIRYFRPC